MFSNYEQKKGKRVKSERNQALEKRFVEGLLKWNLRENTRVMPWKGEKDPYKIWLSEIILQQTRVEQGLKYYENFIRSFPTVGDLAAAPPQQVFKLWEGLGYYSRCRNMMETAQFIAGTLQGIFPRDYASLLGLKGIGNYTAAAISSFAYNLPHAVLDGNVFRVLSRILGVEVPIDVPEGKKIFAQLAQDLLPPTRAGEYNQAIMDFGALICKPAPSCGSCFFREHCRAYAENRQSSLPLKAKKTGIRKRWLHYFIARHQNEIALHQRKGKDIWQELFEFMVVETDKALPEKEILQRFQEQYGIPFHFGSRFPATTQKLTHQHLNISFFLLHLDRKENLEGFVWVPLDRLNQFAFPRSLKTFAEQHLCD